MANKIMIKVAAGCKCQKCDNFINFNGEVNSLLNFFCTCCKKETPHDFSMGKYLVKCSFCKGEEIRRDPWCYDCGFGIPCAVQKMADKSILIIEEYERA